MSFTRKLGLSVSDDEDEEEPRESSGLGDVFLKFIAVMSANPVAASIIAGTLAYLVVHYVYDKQSGLDPWRNSPVDGDHLKGAILAVMVIPPVAGAATDVLGALAKFRLPPVP